MSRKDEYWKIFITETRDEFDKACLYLVDLEKTPSSQKLVDEVFRLLHNMKANTKAMGFEVMGELLHVLENLFSQIRTKQLSFDEKIATAVFFTTDYIERVLEKIEAQEPFEIESELIDNLDKIASGEQYNMAYFKRSNKQESDVVHLTDQVNISLQDLDSLLNLVGELVIDRDQLINYSNHTDDSVLNTLAEHLSRITNLIRDKVMDVRLVNIGALFNKLPRIIRDVSKSEDKNVEIEISGVETKIDRNVLSAVTDSVIHIVRNAVAHGIESPEERLRKKKKKQGIIKIRASSEKGIVIIEIEDDGNGIDYQKVSNKAQELNLITATAKEEISKKDALNLIFLPSLSTSEKITENSGRGVGLDIVKTDLEKLGGFVQVDSKINSFTKFTLSLPISIAVKNCLVFTVRQSNFAIPLLNISSVLKIMNEEMYQMEGAVYMDYQNRTTPLIYLNDFLFSNSTQATKKHINRQHLDVIIVSFGGHLVGLIVDELIRQQELVIKPIKKPLENLEYYGGITVLANGDICFILDVAAVTKNYNLELTA